MTSAYPDVSNANIVSVAYFVIAAYIGSRSGEAVKPVLTVD
jgi:hypothetical protein